MPIALIRDMNKHTRFVCKPNRGAGNVTGADNVLTWRTGFPFGVNQSRGFPRFNPGEYTAADVLALMEMVTEKVLEVHNVRLEPEIKIIGEDA